MYTYKVGINKQDHDDFIKSSNLVSLLQSSSWAKIKDNWDSEFIGFYNNGQMVASASLLIKKLPLGLTMIYVPRGPIMDYENTNLVAFVIKTLKKYGKKRRALFIKIDPPIIYQSGILGQEMVKNKRARLVLDNLRATGIRWSGLTTDMAATIQPRYNALIYKEDFKEEDFSKKTKQFLRKARNSYPIIKYGGTELVDDFSILMKKTEDRKGVSLRGSDYYTKLLATYPEGARITMLYYDFSKLLDDAKKRQDKAQELLDSGSVTNGKKIAQYEKDVSQAIKDIEGIKAIIKENGELVPVAGGLTIDFCGHTEHLYAGMDTSFQKYYPSYLAWYQSIENAFSNGASSLNMGGLENSLSESDGLLNFKKNFNPIIEEYIGEFDIPVNKFLFSLSEAAYKARKKLRNRHK
ncbi:aminoacyltransferase [Streptococcaceae bacterium ESL0729]|nr:aminoacyltransferase [Streptococcaceae bacterium ESL0729]